MAVDKKRSKEAGSDDSVPLRVPRSIRKRVRQRAADEDRTLQDMARELLDFALKNYRSER